MTAYGVGQSVHTRANGEAEYIGMHEILPRRECSLERLKETHRKVHDPIENLSNHAVCKGLLVSKPP